MFIVFTLNPLAGKTSVIFKFIQKNFFIIAIAIHLDLDNKFNLHCTYIIPDMQISFFIAKRYRKKQGNITLIYRLSRLACYSTTLGTAILLLVLSTMNGMEKLLSTLFYAHTPPLKIVSKTGQSFIPDEGLKKNVLELSGVKEIVEVLEASALIRIHSQQAIVTLKGVSSNFPASDFYKNALGMDGLTFLEGSYPEAIAGRGLSPLFQSKICNNRVEVFYPKQGAHNLNNPYKCLTLEIAGFFSIAHKIDKQYMITPIGFVERLIGGLHQRTYWEIVLPDGVCLKQTQNAIQTLLPNNLAVIDKEGQNEPRSRAIFIERLSVWFIFSLVLLLASLHIGFMLCMLIVHKQKEIKTLVSLGATSKQVGRIFLYNGLLLSLEGICYGLVIGCLLGFLQQKFGLITFVTARSKVAYPIEMNGLDVLYTAGLTMLLSGLASLGPMKRARQLAQKDRIG